jgi:energy-coupling factor transport system ATP-binding protein
VRIELRGVRHVYGEGTPFEVEALRGVSLTVEPAEVLGVLGGTGSGKSTLVQHLNLLLTPTSGEVLVDGSNARDLAKGELRKRVGLVFQFPESALFAPTVREDVAFAPRRLGLDDEEVDRRVGGALGALGASHLAGRSPFSLSGGEQRRVAIAGVLAMAPEVLVLDEPTAGLDPATRADLLGVVRGLREGGVSVVVVSHDLDEIAEIADRVCVMHDGEVKAVGSPEEVFYAPPRGGSAPIAPATVRTVSILRGPHPELGRPVRYGETLAALEGLLESGAS